MVQLKGGACILAHRFRGFNCWSIVDLLVLVVCQSGTWWDNVMAKSLPFSISLTVRQERERGKTRVPVFIRGMSVRINFLYLLLPFRVHICPRGTFIGWLSPIGLIPEAPCQASRNLLVDLGSEKPRKSLPQGLTAVIPKGLSCGGCAHILNRP